MVGIDGFSPSEGIYQFLPPLFKLTGTQKIDGFVILPEPEGYAAENGNRKNFLHSCNSQSNKMKANKMKDIN